jgi:hypothetical protein
VQEKAEEKKIITKKDTAPKIIDVTQKLIAYKEFIIALENIKMFDVELTRLGFLKNSPSLDGEVKSIK